MEHNMKNVKTKSLDYILGLITGVAIMITIYACTMNPLQADGYTSERGDSRWNPLYVTVVE